MKKIVLFASMLLAMTTTMCKKDNNDTITSSYNDEVIVVSSKEYQHSPESALNIRSVEITGDSLTIKFYANGCDGESWEELLLSTNRIVQVSDTVAERSLRLSLDNTEECEAYITKTLSYDIKPLQVDSFNTILLRIRNYERIVTYKY